MTWNSGACSPPAGTAAYVSTSAYAEPVRIGDDEVRADEVARVRVQLDESVGFPPVEHGLHKS